MGKRTKEKNGIVVELVMIQDGELVSKQDHWAGCGDGEYSGYTINVAENGSLWISEDTFDDDMVVAVYAANVWKTVYHAAIEAK